MSVFVRKRLGVLRTNNANERGKFFIPWMEGVARHIEDPVARLRFLRIAAPFVGSSPAASGRRRIPLLLLLLSAIVGVIALVVTVLRK